MHQMGALMGGMLLLTVLAGVVVTGIAVMAYRKRNKGSED
jgi:hypothetical protein